MSGNDKKIDEAVISEERAETAISESETEQLSENKNGDCEIIMMVQKMIQCKLVQNLRLLI
ncbi:hypothetical protein DWX71_07190 [Ruminococcus bromii]|nr:hypothetical protein DWX71_07190 [Ruminococcus bromii]